MKRESIAGGLPFDDAYALVMQMRKPPQSEMQK